MDLDDALALLGLERGTDWVAVRGAYRAAMRVAHPDLASGDGDRARRLNEAFAVLEPVYRRGGDPPSRARSAPSDDPVHGAARRPKPFPHDGPLDVTLVDDDGLALVAPADEVFSRLLDALHDVGAVVYADPESSYLEAVVLDGAGQLAVRLQGRAQATEAFFTLESLSGAPLPPIDELVREIAGRLRARA